MTKEKTILKEKPYFVNFYGKYKVLEIYESFSGWYWIVTKKETKNIWYGLVIGLETEYGSFYRHELEGTKGIWKVPKSNWVGVPYISH